MRVLVTGGAGFIGSHVVEALLARDHQVVVVDNLSHGLRDNVSPRAQFIQGDILNPEAWRSQVGQADAMIHLAAQISVPVSEDEPESDVRTNVLGTVGMLQTAQQLGCREFRFASSAAVYGDNPRVPLDEDEAGVPLSYYGLDKCIAEFYVRHEDGKGTLKGMVLRLANVYGPRQRTQGEGGVVAIFSEALAHGTRPVIFGDGGQTRDFIYVGDVAEAFAWKLGEPGPGMTLNIGTETAVTVDAVWRLLADLAGQSADGVEHGPERSGDIRHSRLKTVRAAAWGFQARTPLKEGLRETFQYFQRLNRP